MLQPRGVNPRCFDAVALALYITIAGAAMLHHEPWADEAQSWLLARDLGWVRLIFSELRFEGHPGLWYTILWIAIHWFHAGYSALGWIGLACASMGAAVVIFLAPFPRLLRYPIAFSFYFVYQYAVIARSYNLLPLFAFSAAWCYRQGEKALMPFAMSLTCLALVSLHGALIALALAALWVHRAYRAGTFSDAHRKVRHLLAAIPVVTAFLYIAVFLWPVSDGIAVDDARTISFPQHLLKTLGAIAMSFSNSSPLSFAVAGALYIWCRKRRVLWVFLIAIMGNAFLFGFVRGAAQHVGTLVVGSVVALWCGWPESAEVAQLNSRSLAWHRVSVAALCLLFACQVSWSWSAIRNDWLGPYSGASDAAAYLKPAVENGASVQGFGYISVGLQPYFSRNIFENLQIAGGGSFFRNSREYRRRATLTNDTHLNSVWVVVGTTSPAEIPTIKASLTGSGYTLTHVADGTAFSHSAGLSEKQTYLIFKRRPTSGTQ